MKSLTLKKLEEDKEKLEKLMQELSQRVSQAQTQFVGFQGALAYINDNIKQLKEVGDDRTRTDN